jgi:hypothetical protein
MAGPNNLLRSSPVAAARSGIFGELAAVPFGYRLRGMPKCWTGLS